MTLALASTASAAVLSAGGWYAARDIREQPPEPLPAAPDSPLVIGALPRQPLAFQKREQLVADVWLLLAKAELYRACGLGQSVLTDHEQLVSGQADETLEALTVQAHAYQTAGRCDLAVSLRERYAAIRCATLGSDHPKTLLAVNALGYALEVAGRLDEAQALHSRKRVGRNEEALALHDRVLADLPRLLPDNRSLYLWWGRYRALALQSPVRTDAVACLQSVLVGYGRVLGPHHPFTEGARADLARAVAHRRLRRMSSSAV
ncbi:hypothetical protein [Streptomyces sp. NPDC127119]|uniref:hypothetical protein n=1 Tax=Streptomyces sp. NPDC127119 TaxID=3345370 RepID=UPI003643DCDE